MYHCKDYDQEFEETDIMYLQNGHEEINDYIETCPLCGSVNIEKEK